MPALSVVAVTDVCEVICCEQIVSSVQYCHQKHVVHRDLKVCHKILIINNNNNNNNNNTDDDRPEHLHC